MKKTVFLDCDSVINNVHVKNEKIYSPNSIENFKILTVVIEEIKEL
jgi:hypothetical protein